MFKSIPKEDVTIRPFKVYKNWTFFSGSTQTDSLLPYSLIRNLSGSFDDYNQNSIYSPLGSNSFFNEYSFNKSLRALYYNNSPKIIGAVINWNLSKHNSKKINVYQVKFPPENIIYEYRYYYDNQNKKYVDEFSEFLQKNKYFVSDRGQILANVFTDITKLNGYMKSLGSVQERFIGERTFVFNIPQKYVGEEIKPKSFRLVDYGNTKKSKALRNEFVEIIDDGFGNLIEEDRGYIGFYYCDLNLKSQLNTNEGLVYDVNFINCDFGDEETPYPETASVKFKNDFTASFVLDYVDVNEGFIMSVGKLNPAYPIQNPTKVCGNVFYANGIVTITQKTDNPNEYNYNFGKQGYQISFQSTKTIYENEVFLEVSPNEFNISTNPTATTLENGVRYINKYIPINPPSLGETNNLFNLDFRIPSTYDMLNGTSSLNARKAGFDDYEVSSSIDPTGSFLAPYITTIGLYDDEYNLVAVAKVPSKPKSMPDYPINFVVRFDT